MLSSSNLLGQFIRAHREQLSPPSNSRNQRRRTPGYRREELAAQAGVSTVWLTRLEQGRSETASVTVLARLAQSLQLNPAERATLFELAGKHDPYLAQYEFTAQLPESISQLPMQFNGPCYLLDRYYQAQHWNSQASDLFIGWLDPSSHQRNLLRFMFLESQQAQRLLPDYEERAQRLVSEFRTEFSLYTDDPKLIQFIEQLCDQSKTFARLWQHQQARYRDGGERYFNHPIWGRCHFIQTNLQLSHHPSYKLICLTRQD